MKKKEYFKAMKSKKNKKDFKEKRKESEKIKLIKYQKEDTIIENDTLVGTFKNSRNFGFVIPDEKRIIGTFRIGRNLRL